MDGRARACMLEGSPSAAHLVGVGDNEVGMHGRVDRKHRGERRQAHDQGNRRRDIVFREHVRTIRYSAWR